MTRPPRGGAKQMKGLSMRRRARGRLHRGRRGSRTSGSRDERRRYRERCGVPEECSTLKRVQERVRTIGERYFETTTCVESQKESVIRAMAGEVNAMGKMGVWRRVRENSDEIPARTKIVPTKWVLANKGDTDKPVIRARLVACEVKGAAESEPSLFAPTPPLEALRCVISLASADRRKILDFVDIRKAHMNGRARRKIVVRRKKQAEG